MYLIDSELLELIGRHGMQHSGKSAASGSGIVALETARERGEEFRSVAVQA